MDSALLPCEMQSLPDSVTLILRPAITQSSWSDVEAFGADVRAELEKRNAPACLVDLSPMTYMGSAIVALIVRVWKVVQAKEGKMVVLCPDPAVLEVIQLAGLDKIWTIAREPETASKKLGLRPSHGSMDSLQATGGAGRVSTRMWYFSLGAVTSLLALMAILIFLAYR